MKILQILFFIILIGCTKKTDNTLVLNADAVASFELDSICENNRSFILFKDKKIDFGKVKKKDFSDILIHFPYANIGYTELVIIKTDVSCNCLTATYPTNPLARGKIGVIKVSIDIRNQHGAFNKNVFIKSNATNDVEIIRIKGFVE